MYATPTFINKALRLANIETSIKKKLMTLTALAQPYQVNLATCFDCKSLPTNNQTHLLTIFALIKQPMMGAQQLGITCFKNFWTSFWIIEGIDGRESNKQGSTITESQKL